MAKDLNHVAIIGRLTRDAQLSYSSNGSAICKFSIAVNRSMKKDEQWIDEVSYFDVDFFGRPAEGIKQFLLKGKQVAIDGELRQNRWEKDGQPQSKVVIHADNVQLLGGNAGGSSAPAGGYSQNNNSYNGGSGYNGGSSYNGGQRNSYQQPQQMEPPAYDQGMPYGGNSGGFSEDIPF
ncbi:MAG: single-stranded DNA-binding protein [Treponemataceae bacterium]|nr:single-stranded DNA-binding protein [Treponemataceae bacterium]